ncbi:hypothetical protein D8834_06635 [Streptococcus oralis]|nr:hypothetical protein D8834_06635 [Streptococcus oralis]
MYLLFTGVAFCPAAVVVVGLAVVVEAVHFWMICSKLPSFFICARASLNSVTKCSYLLPFLTPKAKLPTASPSILMLRSCPWLIAYSITGLSSMMAFTAPALRLLFIKSPVSKVLIEKPYLSLILSRKR